MRGMYGRNPGPDMVMSEKTCIFVTMSDISRRDFMRSAAAVGALIATANLPSFAENKPSESSPSTIPTDKPSVFPNRGRFERLSLSYAVVNIGLEKPFSVLHISDTHFTSAYPHENETKQKLMAKRTQTFGGRQEEALRDALSWAKQHVEYIVHTGDLIDWQSEANFDLVKKYFGKEFIAAIGNHEFSPDMGYSNPKIEHTEEFKDLTRSKVEDAYPFDIRFQSQIVNGVNFITLDDIFGYVTEDQVRRFKLEANKGLPIVLCMHVPFFTETIWRADERFWKGKGPMENGDLTPPSGDYKMQVEDKVTRDFISYLKREPLLKCILAGHLHITVEDQFSPWCREYVVGGGFLFHAREVMFI